MSRTSVMSGSTTMPWSAPHFEARPKFSALLLSGLLAAAIPLFLALYWIAYSLKPESVGELLRVPVVGCALLLGFFWYRAPFTHAEALLFRVLAVAAVAWLIPTLMASERAHALAGWIKLLILFSVCAFVARGLRHPPTARAFGLALLVGGVILAVFILFTYVRYLGFHLPTYKGTREFKQAAQDGGVPFNTIAFHAVFSYFMGLCLVPASRLLVFIAAPLVVVSTFFTGSRAPLAILAASVFVLLCLNGLRSRTPWLKIGTAALAIGAMLGGLTLVALTPDSVIGQITEGRSHLWSVALQKFTERPLFGYGYESWRDDLVSRLPGEHELTYNLAKSSGGGYHNEYLTVLAEEGLIGAFAASLIVWLLIRSTWLLSFRQWATVHTGQWPLFAAVFLLLRFNFEVPGLFGYAQDPADYLAYIFLAIVMSRFSLEEDYARSVARSRPGSSS